MASEIKVPASFGACADRLYKIRELKKPFQEKLDALDEERKAIEEYLRGKMSSSQDGGGVGKVAKVVLSLVQEPQVKPENRHLLEKWILKTKDFSVLQAGLKKEAIRERWEAGQTVPGVESFPVLKLSVTKR